MPLASRSWLTFPRCWLAASSGPGSPIRGAPGGWRSVPGWWWRVMRNCCAVSAAGIGAGPGDRHRGSRDARRDRRRRAQPATRAAHHPHPAFRRTAPRRPRELALPVTRRRSSMYQRARSFRPIGTSTRRSLGAGGDHGVRAAIMGWVRRRWGGCGGCGEGEGGGGCEGGAVVMRGGVAKSEHLVKCVAQRAPCRWAASSFLSDLPLEPA
jgi:hypothetical protein